MKIFLRAFFIAVIVGFVVGFVGTKAGWIQPKAQE
jgi:hypothetical protein